jgi:hypothetical protein
VTELSNSTKRFRYLGMPESDDAPEHSSTHANHGGDEDGTTRAVLQLRGDAEEADSESKRRYCIIFDSIFMLAMTKQIKR